MDGTVLLAFLIGLILLAVVGKMLVVPLRYLAKLILNGIAGGIVLLITNFIGASFSIYIPINIVTALIAGFLGVPGVILLIALTLLIR